MTEHYTCTYTTKVTQKSKSFKDGYLTWLGDSSKVVLRDEEGAVLMSSKVSVFDVDEQLNLSGKFLVDVGDKLDVLPSFSKQQTAPSASSSAKGDDVVHETFRDDFEIKAPAAVMRRTNTQSTANAFKSARLVRAETPAPAPTPDDDDDDPPPTTKYSKFGNKSKMYESKFGNSKRKGKFAKRGRDGDDDASDNDENEGPAEVRKFAGRPRPTVASSTAESSTSWPASKLRLLADKTVHSFEVPAVNFSESSYALTRKASLPDSYPNVSSYVCALQAFIFDIIDLEVRSALLNYHALKRKSATASDAATVSYFRRSGVPFYSGMEVRAEAGNFQTRDGKRKTFWSLMGMSDSQREHSSAYSKDDIWILCTDDSFAASNSIFVRSLFHGASSNIPIVPFAVALDKSVESNRLAAAVDESFNKWDKLLRARFSSKKLFAMRLDSLASEISQIEHVSAMATSPLFPFLLNSQERSTAKVNPLPCKDVALPLEKCDEVSELWRLNDDQITALNHVSCWFDRHSITPPFLLVHGVFGSGKSQFLAALVWYVMHCSADVRILIVANTNVAVDNILTRLLAMGLDANLLVRVGSRRKIARSLLKRTVGSETELSDALHELNSMYYEMTKVSPTTQDGDSLSDNRQQDIQAIKDAIDDLQQRKAMLSLSSARICGCTFASCAFASLQGQKFHVCIQDECSQTVEPLSIVPLARFGITHVVFGGDPCQLPPTLPGKSHVESLQAGHENLTILDRLPAIGYVPVMLRTQYRCHPMIGQLANNLFYENRLLNGVTASDRSSLRVPELLAHPVTWVDTSSFRDGAHAGGRGANKTETSVVAYICSIILATSGISKADIGCICMYRAQVAQITGDPQCRDIFCGTVDAFQGGERDVIILSLAAPATTTTFLEDRRRMCVALTRARRHLIIVGTVSSFDKNSVWATIPSLRKTGGAAIVDAMQVMSLPASGGTCVESGTVFAPIEMLAANAGGGAGATPSTPAVDFRLLVEHPEAVPRPSPAVTSVVVSDMLDELEFDL